MNGDLELETYPLVKKWVEKHEHLQSKHLTSGESFFFKIGLLLKSPVKTPTPWIRVLKEFSMSKGPSENAFDESLEVARSLSCDLMQVISYLTEDTVAKGRGAEIYAPLRQLVVHSQTLGLRFLAAWTAFNIDQYRECLTLCEPILDRYSHVYLLAGQAHLHLGEIHEAIETIKVSTVLSPQESAAWFLLAKAYLIADDTDRALSAVQECLVLDAKDMESSFLALLIGTHRLCSEHNRLATLNLTRDKVLCTDLPTDCFLKYIEVALLAPDRTYLLDFLAKVKEMGIQLSVDHPYQAQQLTSILKTLGQVQDFEGSRRVLECLALPQK